METLKYRLQQEITLKNELQASYVKLNNQLSEVRVSYSQEVKLREQLENKVKSLSVQIATLTETVQSYDQQIEEVTELKIHMENLTKVLLDACIITLVSP
jgi:hypothetical protein